MIKFYKVIFVKILTPGQIINIIILLVSLSIINFPFIIIKYFRPSDFPKGKYRYAYIKYK